MGTEFAYRPRRWWQRTIPLWVLVIIGVPAYGLGLVLPFALVLQPYTRTPYTLPAGHSVFVYTISDNAQCDVSQHGGGTFHVWIDRADPVLFTGYRLPRAAAGDTLTCASSVMTAVDPDWRYTLANSQAAKVSLTLIGVFAVLQAYRRIRERIARSRRLAWYFSGAFFRGG
jgi:hypothetical protein